MVDLLLQLIVAGFGIVAATVLRWIVINRLRRIRGLG